jgi:hypothetical protein
MKEKEMETNIEVLTLKGRLSDYKDQKILEGLVPTIKKLGFTAEVLGGCVVVLSFADQVVGRLTISENAFSIYSIYAEGNLIPAHYEWDEDGSSKEAFFAKVLTKLIPKFAHSADAKNVRATIHTLGEIAKLLRDGPISFTESQSRIRLAEWLEELEMARAAIYAAYVGLAKAKR